MGASMLVSAISMINPVTLIAVLAGTLLVGGVNQNKSKAADEVKLAVSSKIAEEISKNAEKNSADFADKIYTKFTEIVTGIIDSVDIEIEETDNRIKAIISEMEKGSANIAEKNRLLDECENKIKELSTALDDFIFKLMD